MANSSKLLLVLFLAGASASCRDNPGSKQIAEGGKVKTVDTRAAERDAQFVANEIAAHIRALDWIELALRGQDNQPVKHTAATLKKDHERLLNQWRLFAERKNIVNSDSILTPNRDEIEKFVRQSNDSLLYKDWVDEMLEQEQKLLSRLEDYLDDAGDPALKLIMQDELPLARMHRDQLMSLKSRL